MASWQARALRAVLRVTVKRPLAKRERSREDAVRTARRVFQRGDARNRVFPRGVRIVRIDSGAVRGEWVIAGHEPRERAILYAHGGGFIACTPLTYRAFAIALARATGAPVFVVDYRRAPEHRFPAALDDILGAYDALRARIPAAGIAHVGDSAGGGLALSAALALRARDPGSVVPLAGIVVYSPWTDLLCTGASNTQNTRLDDMLVSGGMASIADAYADLAERHTPLASPLYGDFSGFPPTRVYASDIEILRDDAVRFTDRARSQDVPIELVLEAQLPHVWPLFVDVLPEARRTLADTAAFLQRVWLPYISTP
jgi:monoterpene epsilon-lactone hydrolase